MGTILNAAPQSINLGAKDNSKVIVHPAPKAYPQHLPKMFIYAQKGTTDAIPFVPAELELFYGSDTFDKNKKWYNHQTKFANKIAGQANMVMLQRVIPADANPPANLVLYIDIVADKVPNYIRNSDGSYVLDTSTNEYKVDTTTATIDGYRVKFIKEWVTTPVVALGMYTSKTGKMTSASGTSSTMHPILELKATAEGSDYNLNGLSLANPIESTVNRKVVNGIKGLTYDLSLVKKATVGTSFQYEPSIDGYNSVPISFVPKARNPITNSELYLDTVFDQSWTNLTDQLKPTMYPEFAGLHVYDDNIATVLDLFMTTESAHVTTTATAWNDGVSASTLGWFDFTTADADAILDEKYMLNMFNCKSSYNVPYFTVMLDDTTITAVANSEEVSISKNTPIYLSGGTDGSLTATEYNRLVEAEMAHYLDENSKVMDLAVNIESTMYDTGFPLETKKSLAAFISARKDTWLVYSTYIEGYSNVPMTISDHQSVANSLYTTLELMPESTYYGTTVARAIVVMGSGIDNLIDTKERTPQSYSLATKIARYMGAGNGEWKPAEEFTSQPGSIITELIDIEPSFIPEGMKPSLWASGIMYSQPADRTQFFFPATQTVYDDDTSVLNSLLVVAAMSYLTKVAHNAWAAFTGSTNLTQGELADGLVKFVKDSVRGKFDNQITVTPEVQFTSADIERGYSWRLINKVEGNPMKTVQVYTTEVYRTASK